MWTPVRTSGFTVRIRTKRNITAANGGFSSARKRRTCCDRICCVTKVRVCFTPEESERKRRALAHEGRRTPLNIGNRPGTNRSQKPKRPAGDSYGKDSYNRAIRRAVEKANDARRKAAQEAGIDASTIVLVPRWHANQLRHTTATKLRSQFGLGAARTVLGHADPKITLTYAEADFAKAAEAMMLVG